uniref:Uncharacterized protein n=1 Tax=mine drainage metagenome TaxID=410659 RepID=E6PUK6_9ZZZZ
MDFHSIMGRFSRAPPDAPCNRMPGCSLATDARHQARAAMGFSRTKTGFIKARDIPHKVLQMKVKITPDRNLGFLESADGFSLVLAFDAHFGKSPR